MIPLTFPACTPLPGQMHLSIHCLPISPWGQTGPLEEWILLLPTPRRQPHLPWLLSPDTWYNRAGAYRAFPGLTASRILCCSSSLKYGGNGIWCTLLELLYIHGQRSLAGYSPWGHKELDTTEQLNFH